MAPRSPNPESTAHLDPLEAPSGSLVVLIHGSASNREIAAGLDTLSGSGKIALAVVFSDITVDPRCGDFSPNPQIKILPALAPGTHPIDQIRRALTSIAGADIAVVLAGTVVEHGWHDALRAIAYADSTTATVSAVSLHSKLETSRDQRPRPSGTVGSAPAISTPRWGCVFVRRDALDLALATRANAVPRSASVTCALEALVGLPGLVHRLATTTVVGAVTNAATDQASSVGAGARRILDIIEAERESIRVLVDLRCCAFPISGTQVQALQLIHALSGVAEAEFAVLLPEVVDRSLSAEVARLPMSVQRYTSATLPSRRPHVFHRPYQLLQEHELAEAVTLGDRLVITQQDMILSRNPSYFRSDGDWRRFTQMTQVSFLVADHVAFFSPHALDDALSDAVLNPDKVSVVPLGTDHTATQITPREAGSADRLDVAQPFLLVLGNAYLHKNRLHALHILDRLQHTGRWRGGLVFAGGHPPFGGSSMIEQEYLELHPAVAEHVVDVGPVNEGQKAWLYRDAAMALYPTLYEGFGLVPFEAAAFGTPVAYSRRSALSDFLPGEGALLEGWNADVNATRIARVLADPVAQSVIVDAIREAGRSLTWERTARAYIDIYRRVLARPAGFSLALGDLSVGPGAATLGPRELRVLKAYRRSALLKLVLDSIVSTGVAARRWIASARAR